MDAEITDSAIPALAAFLGERRSQAHCMLNHLIGLGRAFLRQSELLDAMAFLSLQREDASVADF